MTFPDPNSLALPLKAADVGMDCRQQKRIHSRGAKVLEAMGQLGRRAEFERQIKQHLDATTGLAVRLTGNQDRAEELVQETMLRAIRNWDSFREQAQFKTWLYRILINAFRDQLRRKPPVEIAAVEPVDCATRDPSVEARAEAAELGSQVAKLITALPERQREVLVLATYDSLSNQEIATTLKISIANVHSNLSAARKKLKQQLAPFLKND